MPVAYRDLSLVYIAGEGDIAFGACRASGPLDTLRICGLRSPAEIGADALGLAESSDFSTFIHFGSLRSLDVLLDVLGKIRESMVAAGTDPTVDTVHAPEELP